MEVTGKLFEESKRIIQTEDMSSYQRLVKYETLNDFLDEQVEKSVRAFTQKKLSRNDAHRSVLLVRLSNNLERLGDVGRKLGDTGKELVDSGSPLTGELSSDFHEVYETFMKNLKLLETKLPVLDSKTVRMMKANEKKMRDQISSKYTKQLKTMQFTEADTEFVELLSVIEAASGKVRDMRKLMEAYSKHRD